MTGSRARLALVLLSSAAIQRGVASQIHLFGVVPDLMVLVAIAAGLTSTPDRGATVGFFAGLLFDLVVQGPLGLGALAFLLVGYGAGRFHDSSVRSSRMWPIVIVVVGTAAGELLYVAVGQLVDQSHMFTGRLRTIVLVTALVNGLLAPIALRALRWAWRDDPRYRNAHYV